MQLAVSRDGKQCAIAGAKHPRQRSGHVSLYDFYYGLRLRWNGDHEGGEPAINVAFSPNGNRMLTVSTDNNIYLWNTKTDRVTRKLSGEKEPAICSAFYSQSGDFILSATFDERIQIWRVNDGELLETAQKVQADEEPEVRCLALSSDGTKLATCGKGQVVNLWSVQFPER